eukprot:362396-Chlamydomonas_euryale.AAC.3
MRRPPSAAATAVPRRRPSRHRPRRRRRPPRRRPRPCQPSPKRRCPLAAACRRKPPAALPLPSPAAPGASAGPPTERSSTGEAPRSPSMPKTARR